MSSPTIFRKEGRCLKVISATVAYVITLPPQSLVPLRDIVTFPDNERLKEEISKMEAGTDDTWQEFVVAFYRGVKEEQDTYSKVRAQMLKPKTQ